jgi:hypothetical protein
MADKSPPDDGSEQGAFDFSAPAEKPADKPAKSPHFNGPEYIPERDHVRLTGQLLRVWECMKDEQWRTLPQIAQATGDPTPSISAQLRHLRKPRFGAHTMNRRHIKNGLHEYQIVPRGTEPPTTLPPEEKK